MNSEKVETLLERIAVALERLAGQANHRGSFADGHHSRADTEEGAVDASPQNSAPAPPSILEPFLNSKGIQIKVWPTDDAADQVIDSLSLYLGGRYDALRTARFSLWTG